MEKYYFTYGTSDSYPYNGGWTEVYADDKKQAIALFRAVHPDVKEGIINCASIYTENAFLDTEMSDDANFGERCHEAIRIFREVSCNVG